MKTMLRPLLLMAAVLVAVVCIVFCGALFWINSGHGLNWVQARINTTIPGRITIEDHRLSLLGPELDLYGVVLHDTRDNPLVGFSHLHVRFVWRGLWRRAVHLETVLLEAPWADLVLNETGGLNLMAALVSPAKKEAEATPPERTGLPVNVILDAIRVTDGRVAFRPSDDTLRLETAGITISAAGNLLDQSAILDLEIASVLFTSAGFRPQPARFALKARLEGDTLALPAIEVTSGQTALMLSGSAGGLYTTPVVDTIVSIRSQLDELKTAFDVGGNYSGQVKAELSLKGTVANPDAGLILSLEGGRIAGQPVDRVDLSLNLQDRQIGIDTAAVRLAGGAITLNGTADLRGAFPDGFLSPPADTDAIAYTLAMVQDIPDLNPWLTAYTDISGKAAGRLSLAGSGLSPAGISARLTLDGAGRNLTAPGMDRPVDAAVSLSARMDRETISISRLGASASGVEVSGTGRFQMNDGHLDGSLSLTADDLSRALAVAGLMSVTGAGNAALTVGGSLSRPQFALTLDSKNLAIDAFSIGDLTVAADMDHAGMLDLHTLVLQNQGSRVEGNGRLRLLPDSGGIDPAYQNRLNLSFENLSAAAFMERPPMDGTLDGRLEASGPMESLSGKLFLNGSGLAVDAATIGDVDASMRLEDGTVFLDRFHLRNHDSSITATGSIQLLASHSLSLVQDPLFDFTVESGRFDPGDFIDGPNGLFTVKGALSGSVENPAGHAAIAGRGINLAGQPIESLSIDARFAEKRLWLDRLLAAVGPGEQIEGTGWVGLDKTIDLRLWTGGIPVYRIQRLHDLFPGKGMFGLDVKATGRMDNPDIDGRLIVSDIIINEEAIDDFNLTFTLRDMLARATGSLNFEMDAACDLKKGDFDAHLIFDRTEINSYLKAAGKPDFHGTLTGRVQAAGNIHDAANATVQADLDGFHLLYKDKSLIHSGRMAAGLADRELTIPEFEVVVLDSGSLRLKGDARIGGRLNMIVDGRIPLTAAGLFIDELADAAGILKVTGTLAGETADPQIDARIDLENIGMTVPGLVQKLHDLNGRIYLTADTIRIDSLNGLLDTGTFSLNGIIAHETFTPTQVDLAIGAKSLPLEVPDTLTVLLNGDINITGSDETAAARGTIVLLEGVYYKDVKINLLQMSTTRQRAVPPAARPLAIPYFKTVDLDIKISHRQPFVVQNNLAQLEISPDLKIGGTLANPIVSGRAQVREGTVTFQKKTFDVEKGVIDFVNPYKTEAEIDIQSQTQIRTWEINLSIKGTPENLDVALTSQPAETDADILSLILFGRTARELSAGEGGAQRTTGQIMAEMIADTFGDDIKRTTGVDILQLETNGGSGDSQDDAGVKVTVGKHLSDRMTVKYAVESKDGEFIQRAITEYKLLENILVSGFQDNQGVYGSELVFRIEFR